MFAYHVGVAATLVQKGAIDTKKTHIAGASAGALIATDVSAGVLDKPGGDEILLAAARDVCEYCRNNGARGNLRAAVEPVYRNILPDDAHERFEGRCHVAVTLVADATRRVPRPFVPPRQILVSEFEDKNDVVNAVLASCHIPGYFDGQRLIREYRGSLVWDGGVTGSPKAFAPLPPSASGSNVLRPQLDVDAMSIDELDASLSWDDKDDETNGSVVVSCLPYAAALGRFGFDPQLAPGKFSKPPFSAASMLTFALGTPPMTDKQTRKLYESGAKDAEAWLATYGKARVL